MGLPGMLDIPSMRGQCSQAEWQTRVDLAACYRLVHWYGMADMMANHISARVPDEENAFLINPYGMMYEEISASCVINTHSWASMAVSVLECGLLPLTQTAMRFLKIGYHDYQGVVLDTAEQASLVADLGAGEALILRNHGALTVGRTVGEAFNWMHRLELACRAQLAAMACGTPLRTVPADVLHQTWNNYQPGTRRPYGVMEWPALLRKLDRLDPGYRD